MKERVCVSIPVTTLQTIINPGNSCSYANVIQDRKIMSCQIIMTDVSRCQNKERVDGRSDTVLVS